MVCKIRKKLKSKSGAAVVYVIVAATLLTMIGTTCIMAAYAQLAKQRLMNQSQNNLYSAETVLNVLTTGLEQDVSTAYSEAYNRVMESFTTEYHSSATEAQAAFNASFLTNLQVILTNPNDYTLYNLEKVRKYVEDNENFKQDVAYTITAVNNNNYIDITDESIILRNIHVTYEDNSGYYNEISTDIKIDVPDMKFVNIDGNTNVPTTFAVMADGGLNLDESTGLMIDGDVFLGSNSNNQAIVMKPRTAIVATNADEFIAAGDIDMDKDSDLIVGDQVSKLRTDIWTSNINVGNNGTLNLSGQTYVYDDVTADGN